MNIAVDIGNTSAKIGFFKGEEMIEVIKNIEHSDLLSVVLDAKGENIIMSSVAKFDPKNVSNIRNNFDRFIILDHQTLIPIKNNYETPETLGVDRLAAVVGASKLFPHKNCLTIDIGTCMTYDLINSEGEYLGGAISPGLSMKMKALNTFTARLPLVDIEEGVELIGRTTKESIQSGVILGTIAELDEMIRQFQLKASDIKVIMCGGFANFFESKLKEPIFALPELVLIGLNTILLHNVE